MVGKKKKVRAERFVELPEGFEVVIDNEEVIMKGNGKELKRNFNLPNVEIVKEGNKIKIIGIKKTKREGKLIGTLEAHLKNMIAGLQEDFVYTLEIANVHFPMTVKVEGDNVVIKNFLGEKVDRNSRIVGGANVEVKGSEIIVSSQDKESAGQTAANLEKAARLTGRDRRIFQDGIFITNKAGREI